jgi:predicted transposase YdaD
LNLSKAERRQYESHIGNIRNAQSTLESSCSEGETKGRKEGLAEGLAKGQAAVILAMYHSGLPIEQSAQIVKLSVDQVRSMIEVVSIGENYILL